MPVSPNMGLPIAVVGSTPGPDYATDVNAALSLIDQHTHNNGSGVPITPSGININTDLTFANNAATNLRASIYTAQASQTTIKAVYVKGVDLYFRDGNNNEIAITTSGSVNAGAGSITGLPSGTAGVAFSGGVFTFSASTNTPANIQIGSLLLGNNSALSNYLTLAPPSAMAASFAITLPSLPASQSILTLDNSGAMATPVVYPIPSAGIAALAVNTSNIAAQAVTAAKIANATITTTQIAGSTITGSNIASATVTGDNLVNSTVGGDQLAGASVANSASCGTFNSSASGNVSITNMSVSLTLNGNKQVWMRLEPAFLGGHSLMGGLGAILQFRVAGVTQYQWTVGQSSDGFQTTVPCSGFSATVASGASGAVTYDVIVNPAGNNFDMQNIMLKVSQAG